MVLIRDRIKSNNSASLSMFVFIVSLYRLTRKITTRPHSYRFSRFESTAIASLYTIYFRFGLIYESRKITRTDYKDRVEIFRINLDYSLFSRDFCFMQQYTDPARILHQRPYHNEQLSLSEYVRNASEPIMILLIYPR